MYTKIIVAVALASILTLLIISLLKKKGPVTSEEKLREQNAYRNCPICETPLLKGETVHSHLFPGKPDGMMYIYGCPFCFKDHPKAKGGRNVQRRCPYCRQDIPDSGYVVARVFEKPEKTHVHVLGCTVCRRVT